MFNFHEYIKALAAENRLARAEGFEHVTCTGINGLEGVLDNLQTYGAFLASDDVTTGETFRGGGGYFRRRTFTLFILRSYDIADEADRRAKLDTCRTLMRQMQSRMLLDRDRLAEQMVYLEIEQMPTTEIGSYFGTGATGLYFMVTLSEPTDLSYNADEWNVN